MLKDIVIDLTENYHNLGHHGSSVDAMMDSVSGMGHRMKHGHDIQGLIESYHLQGFEGIGLWFDHMAKDFTSPAGIPLPFAEAIYNVSGMQMDTAVDWLTINAYDVGALITQELALKLFKENKKAYNIAFILGSAIGIIDDNPAIVVVNTLRLLKAGKLQRLLSEGNMQFIERAGKITGRACMGTAAATLGAGAVGVNIPELIESGGEWLDHVEQASTLSDLVDGISTLGVMLLVSKGVKAVANSINEELLEKVQLAEERLSLFNSLERQAITGASPIEMSMLIEQMEERKMLPGDGR
ncbi:MAG: hypothetical protein ABS948_05410 [Solibacillus sp.]